MIYDTSRYFITLAFLYFKGKDFNRHPLPAFANNRDWLDSGGIMGRNITKRSKGQPPQQKDCKGHRKATPVLNSPAVCTYNG